MEEKKNSCECCKREFYLHNLSPIHILKNGEVEESGRYVCTRCFNRYIGDKYSKCIDCKKVFDLKKISIINNSWDNREKGCFESKFLRKCHDEFYVLTKSKYIPEYLCSDCEGKKYRVCSACNPGEHWCIVNCKNWNHVYDCPTECIDCVREKFQKELATPIQEWYDEEYTYDPVTKLNDTVTFKDLLACLETNGNVDELLGTKDIFIRNMILCKLCSILKIDYEDVHSNLSRKGWGYSW